MRLLNQCIACTRGHGVCPVIRYPCGRFGCTGRTPAAFAFPEGHGLLDNAGYVWSNRFQWALWHFLTAIARFGLVLIPAPRCTPSSFTRKPGYSGEWRPY